MTKTETETVLLESAAQPLLNLAASPDLQDLKLLCDKAGSEITLVTNLAEALGLPASIPVFIDRQSGRPISVKSLLDEWRTSPERKAGSATVNVLESFIGLTKRHATKDSVIFADTNWKSPSLTAIIDYHRNESGGPADNCKHRIKYPFPLTEEWSAWVANNSKMLNQTQFAEFIEDHRADLASPHDDEVTYWQELLGGKMAYPNELQMLSRGLKIHAETKASSAVTLATGEGEIAWEETHTARDAKGGKIVVPSLFMISVAPFYQGEKARVPVRLRYRLPQGGGAVGWFYQLYRPDIYITEQVIRDLDRASSETDLPAFQGSPETSGSSSM
jgi:uncharacterized protein YfdQ (DUF2303 family)|nr:DUF2303 family protein [Neorhizobium tomejilense]